ncbi:MAG: InlB B-repeat-containing protein, partial [Calditrichia bacterium]|nr:InlB B-repeat-containing protein [Calditrichia bacterium]
MKRLLLYPALIFIFFLLLDQNVLAQGSTIIFSATGDVPYGSNEYPILEQQIVDHNLYSPSKFLIHVGDIKEGTSSCPESIYEDVSAMLKELAVPVYIVPGDNEYNDCSNPTQAWQYWTTYFMNFEENFCGAFATEHQGVRQENFAFVLDGVLFIGINLVGGRVHSQSEWNTRMQQDADWVEFQFQDKISQVRAAVVFAQAGPGNSNRNLFFDQFEQSAADFAKPILFLHGDGHSWKLDKPFPQQNVTRVQVNMGGNEDPVQVTVNMDPTNPWVFKRNPWSNNPPLYNVAPCVEAGADTTITMPASASLHARASDDGVPLNPGNITLAWSKISGPGTVTFGNPSSATTTASFSAAGTYVLRLTANDGALQNYDELAVTVQGTGAYLSINDVEVTEGNSGSVNAVFTVTRSGGAGISFTVNYATADSTATAGSDYTSVSGTLSFSGSTTTRTITVPVLGETLIEPDEYFLVNLSNPSNATISDGKGIGTILNDDFPPPPSISSFTPSEGPVGTEVSISGANFVDVTEVAFNGLAASNYVVESATLIRAFVPPGATTGKIRITTATGMVQSANNFLVKASLALATYGSGSVTLDPPGGIYNAGTVVTLNATADPGWMFIGWAGDLSSTANPETVAMNGDKSIIASFAQEGVGPVVHRETQTGASSDVDTVSLSAPIAGVSGQLYLAAISNRGNIPVASVTGLGLSWSLVRAQCSGRDITGVEIWMALGSVAGGDIVTATFSGSPANAVMAVSRYSGIDMDDPIRVIISGNTNGEEGACADGTDSDFYTFDLPITLSRELVYSAAALRNRTHTPGPGYTEQVEISQGSGSQMAGLAVQDQEAFLPAAIPVAGSLSSDVDWAVAGLILRPGVRFIPNYALTLNTNGSGAVDLDPAGGTYDSARVVTLTAMPDSGWSFSGWSGDLSGVANPDSIVMNSDKTVTATFSELPQYTLTLNQVGAGVVTLTPPGGVYYQSSAVILSAAPDSGYVFSGWSGDLSGSANPDTIIMNGNRTITATFTELQQFALEVDTVGLGAVTLNPPGGLYYDGTVVTLAAVADSGYEFSGWSGDLSGSANPDSILMDTAKHVTAIFTELPRYTLTVNSSGAGSVTLDPAGGTYYAGTAVILIAAPDSGYFFTGWSGDLSGADNPDTLVMDGNKTVTAAFADLASQQFTLTANASGSGSVQLIPPGGIYSGGTTVTATAIPAPGFDFLGWSGELSGSLNPEAVFMDSNKDITAEFALRGEGSVTFEEVATGAASNNTTVTTSAPLTGVNGDLYLAAITSRQNVAVSSVSGLGLTWTLVDAQCAARSVTRVEVWMAQGTPDPSGTVTATLSASVSNLLIAVSRYSGVDPVAPVGAIVSSNTLGIDGACTGGNDTNGYAFNLTTTRDSSVVYAAIAPRNRTHTPGAGYIQRAFRQQGSGGEMAGVAVQDQKFGGPAPVLVNGSLSGVTDWAVIAVEIKPGETGGTPTYTLNVNTSGAGNVILDPPGGYYNDGRVVTLAAAPDSGYVFTGWSGDLTGSANPDSMVMDGNKTVTAIFSPRYTLTVAVNGPGAIELDPPGGIYDSLTVVRLIAIPDSGYGLAGWSGDLSGVANPDSLLMDGNKSVTATFTRQFSLGVSVQGGGAVALDPSGGVYDSLEVVTLTATADSGWVFAGWSGDLSGSANPDSLLMDGNKSVTATFTRQFSLSVSVVGGGAVALDPSGGIYDSLQVVRLTATADSGWVFAGWSGDLSGSANPDSLLMDGDKSVTATFTRQFSLSVSVQGGGAVAFDPPGGIYDSLEVVTLTATADSGWVFAGWSGDLSGFANPDSL